MPSHAVTRRPGVCCVDLMGGIVTYRYSPLRAGVCCVDLMGGARRWVGTSELAPVRSISGKFVLEAGTMVAVAPPSDLGGVASARWMSSGILRGSGGRVSPTVGGDDLVQLRRPHKQARRYLPFRVVTVPTGLTSRRAVTCRYLPLQYPPLLRPLTQ